MIVLEVFIFSFSQIIWDIKHEGLESTSHNQSIPLRKKTLIETRKSGQGAIHRKFDIDRFTKHPNYSLEDFIERRLNCFVLIRSTKTDLIRINSAC